MNVLKLLLALVAICTQLESVWAQTPDAGPGVVLSACFASEQKQKFNRELCEHALQHTKQLNELQIQRISSVDRSQAKLNEQVAESNAATLSIIKHQLTVGPILLVVVIAVVAAGIFMSYLQFKNPVGTAAETSLEISRDGLKVRSPVIGLVVLAASLVFFYMYLVNVYKISRLGVSDSGTVVLPPSRAASEAN